MNPDSNVSGFEYPDDPFDPDKLVTNDAVGGEPVKPTRDDLRKRSRRQPKVDVSALDCKSYCGVAANGAEDCKTLRYRVA